MNCATCNGTGLVARPFRALAEGEHVRRFGRNMEYVMPIRLSHTGTKP